ncbi:hypothetical protein INP45_09930, partial [Staphylococcus aureus]|nr:hypothetical protein [Staphylococcus aureus]
SLKTLYRKRTVIWPFYFYTIIRTLSIFFILIKSSRLNNILTILSIVLVIIHMGILAHSTYVYLY